MARVTVEDCLQKINNRFELVLVAAKRAKQLAKEAATPLVPLEGDKVTVVALREIAEGLVDKNILDRQTPQPDVMLEDFGEISSEIISETQTTEIEETATSDEETIPLDEEISAE